jgi:hypothetical protein
MNLDVIPLLKVLATIQRASDKKSRHILDEKYVLLLAILPGSSLDLIWNHMF